MQRVLPWEGTQPLISVIGRGLSWKRAQIIRVGMNNKYNCG